MKRIALYSRTELVRAGLAELLTDRSAVDVSTFDTIEELLAMVGARPPSLVVFELERSGDWRRRAERLRRSSPTSRLVGLSPTRAVDIDIRHHGMGCLDAVVSLRASAVELLEVLGLPGPRAVEPVASIAARRGRELALTPREIEVLQALSAGCSTAEIAAVLGRSAKTVENHKQHIYAKLGVQNQSHAVAVGVRRGLITPIVRRHSEPVEAAV